MHVHYHRKNVTKPVLLLVFNFYLDREGIKEREDGEMGGGDYSREAIH